MSYNGSMKYWDKPEYFAKMRTIAEKLHLPDLAKKMEMDGLLAAERSTHPPGRIVLSDEFYEKVRKIRGRS